MKNKFSILLIIGCLAIAVFVRLNGLSGLSADFVELDLNEKGDALAGFFGSLAFLVALIALIMQSIELSAQREELKRQANEAQAMNKTMSAQLFEHGFFEMLATLSRIVSDLEFKHRAGEVRKGRAAFERFKKELKQSIDFRESKTAEDVAIDYSLFWDNNRSDLSHYFRFLYNFFRYVSESEFAEKRYGKLIRSQLTSEELTLLFYNCLSEDGWKFTRYAEEFELFDNMKPRDLFHPDHARFLDAKVYGENAKFMLGK